MFCYVNNVKSKRDRSDVGLLYYLVGKYWSREKEGPFRTGNFIEKALPSAKLLDKIEMLQ